MPYSFSIADLQEHEACHLAERVADLEAHLGREVPMDEAIPMSVWAEVTPHTLDLIWALRCRPEGRAIAAKVARRAADRVPWGTLNAEAAYRHTHYAECAVDAVDASRYARAGVWAAVFDATDTGGGDAVEAMWADVRADILELTAT